MTKWNRWIAVAALGMVSSTVLAAPVTFTANGQVLATDTNDGIFGVPFSGPVGIDTPVSVTWTFDLDLFGADTNAASNVGVYGGGGISARVQVGNDVFQPIQMQLGVLPGSAGAGLTTYSFAFTGLGDFASQPQRTWLFAVNFEVADASGLDSLPVSLNPAGFQDMRLQYQIQQGLDASQPMQFDAFVASLTPVPLPAAGWLLFAGVGALTALRKKRSPEA